MAPQGDPPATPPAGFAGPGGPPPGTPQPPAVVATVATAPVRRPTPKRSKGPAILAVLAVLASGALVVVVRSMLSDGADAEREATQIVASTTIVANPDNDPEVLAFVQSYCRIEDKALAQKVPAYDPSSSAMASVLFDQAIGAPGPRTESFVLPVAPEVGTPIDREEIPAITATDVRLAACVERRAGVPTDVACTYSQDPTFGGATSAETTLFQTPYEITVTEVRTGKVIATGQIATSATECPTDPQVELSDDVSGPMTIEAITAWFTERFVGGVPR